MEALEKARQLGIVAADKEAALGTVDELRRRSKKQEGAYDALVSSSRLTTAVCLGCPVALAVAFP